MKLSHMGSIFIEIFDIHGIYQGNTLIKKTSLIKIAFLILPHPLLTKFGGIQPLVCTKFHVDAN